jgi:FtsH-binding integral membrane protein
MMIFNSSFLYVVTSSKMAIYCVIGVQLGLVLLINFLTNKVTAGFLRGLFLLYAASMGVTFSLLLLLYPQNVIFKAFLTTSLVYGSLAAYGLLTKRSLQRWGAFLFMALVGLIIAMIINIFARSVMADYVISWFGVIIFAGLTAYDHQKLRVIHANGFANEDIEKKVVIHGALTLYLDFVNLFIFLVKIMGNRR